MRLKLNGEDKEFEQMATVGDLLDFLQIKRERVAVMLNDDVVRRADLGTTPLHDGDAVEVITMVGGG